MTLAEAMAAARRAGLARIDAQWLLGHVLGRSRAWLIAHDTDALEPAEAAAFQALCARLGAGEPLAYLVGALEFQGVTLEVNADVLVPRPDTEVLVDWAIELLRGGTLGSEAPTVVDLGTGSGAIALAVKHAVAGAEVCATDTSEAALAVARRNAGRLGLDVEFRAGPWWAPLAGRRFALALSNPPYVAGDDPHLAALTHEPRGALTPGGDGLGALREIVAGAGAHLQPGGWLLLEHGHDQADAVTAMFDSAGFADMQGRRDPGGHIRCTGARRS